MQPVIRKALVAARDNRKARLGALFFLTTFSIAGLSHKGYGFGTRRMTAPVGIDASSGAPSIVSEAETEEGRITKAQLAQAISDNANFYQFPSEVKLKGDENSAIVQYSFDAKLQDTMEQLMKSYKPDYGAFVAIDAKTGRILSMVSYNVKGIKENLALRATFPSASVFKVVTAAAAISERHFSADTVIPFNGRAHTLYRSNILKDKVTRWTQYPSLKHAFANSINTVFGKIGAFTVGPQQMRTYADRFGFNRKIAADFVIPEGHASIPDDPWAVAEASSGYTRMNTMSPLQGALIASTVVNDGTTMEPYLVQNVHAQDGSEVYSAKPKVANVAIDPKTAAEVRALMRETVASGTGRKSFRGFFRKEYADLQVGGKTGSLTGLDPKGKYDWYVGYADDGDRKLAFAALTIHERLWRVKSSYLGRRAIEAYFKKDASNDDEEPELASVAKPKHRRHKRHRRSRRIAHATNDE